MDTDCFGNQAFDLGKKGGILIGPVKCLLPQRLLFHQTGVEQLSDLSLHRAGCDVRTPGELTQVEGLINMAIQDGEHRRAGASEERSGNDACCTHSGVNRTRKRYRKQIEFLTLRPRALTHSSGFQMAARCYVVGHEESLGDLSSQTGGHRSHE